MSGELPSGGGGTHAVFPGRGGMGNGSGTHALPQNQQQQHQGFHPRGMPSRAGGGSVDPALSIMYKHTALFPEVPKKIVTEDHSLTEVFRQSASFQKIVCYLQACSESIFSTAFSLKKRASVVAALAAKHGALTAEQDEDGQSDRGAGDTSAATAVLTVEGEPAAFSPPVTFFLTEFFPYLNGLVDDIPLEDVAQQRFGNRAKREFHRQMEAVVEGWTRRLVDTLPAHQGRDIAAYSYEPSVNSYTLDPPRAQSSGGPPAVRSEAEKQRLAVELAAYVKDSFGNATRLDFGTGHELHFFIVLMICLEEMGDRGGTLLTDPAERDKNVFVPLPIPRPDPVPMAATARTRELRRQMVFYVFQEYLNFVRRLQHHYGLEPAGSHGVWGLDDYHHIPYIFGAAQLIGMERPHAAGAATTTTAIPAAPSSSGGGQTSTHAPTATGQGDVVLPKYVCDKAKVKALCDEYMYFQMIQWILENKSGPFHEHSNTLYNISAVELWFKTYSGMTKMYAAEVLSKFNVVQHLLFGRHLPWNTRSLDMQPEDVAPAKVAKGEGQKATLEAEHFL